MQDRQRRNVAMSRDGRQTGASERCHCKGPRPNGGDRSPARSLWLCGRQRSKVRPFKTSGNLLGTLARTCVPRPSRDACPCALTCDF
jgi:hypothetical protein